MKSPAQFVLLLFFTLPAWGYNTWYISTTGSDSNSGTSPGAAFATFTHALAAMSGCDTLIVESGYYYDSLNMSTSNLAGNVGSTGCYTVVEAATPFAVTVDSSLLVTQPNATVSISEPYIQVIGIEAASYPTCPGYCAGPWSVIGTNHVKLQKTAGFNAPCGLYNNDAWNVDVYAVGPASSYVLIEDSHAWGCGRYKFLAYQSSYVIFRRDVARHDFAGAADSPLTPMSQCGGFVNYDSQYTLFQNDIVVDSGDVAQDTGVIWGGLWSEHHQGIIDNIITYEGSIVDNVQGTSSWQDTRQSGAHTFINDASVNSSGGLYMGPLIVASTVTGATVGTPSTITSSESNPIAGNSLGIFQNLTGSASSLNGGWYTVPSLFTITSITGTAPNMVVNGSNPDWNSSWIGGTLSIGGATNAGNDSNNSGGTQFTITGGSTTSISYTNASGVAEIPPGTAWVEVSPEFKVNYVGPTAYPFDPIGSGVQFNVLVGQTAPTVNAEHLTIANVLNASSSYSDAGNGALGIGLEGIDPFMFYDSQLVSNSIIQGTTSAEPNTFAAADWINSNYNYYYQNKVTFGSTFYGGITPTAGPHDVQGTNPQIKYITREETGTPVYGTASDGGNIGATILYEIGTTGTLYGDTGYDTVTGTSLWPFPNEAVIKTDMASFSMVNPITSATISGTRGFAASGTSLCGAPLSLTTYIWEALGYPTPSGMETGCSGYALSAIASPNFGGTVTPTGGSTCAQNYSTSGVSYSCTATPSSGYSFASWASCPGTAAGAICSGTMPASNIVVQANFSNGVTYMLSTATNGTGSGAVSGTNCPASGLASGASYSCTATPASGSVFAGWSSGCGGVGSGNVYSGTITSNCTVTATFNLAPTYTLSTSTTGLGSGTVTGSSCAGTYTAGSAYSCTATANSGSSFGGWTSTCGGTATGTTYAGSMPALNCNVTATFNLIPLMPSSQWLGIAGGGFSIH